MNYKQKNNRFRVVLSGGGTGGHIYPAIAIANEIKRRYPETLFLFVGAKDRMEMEKVPQAGFKIKGLWISGIQRKLTFQNLMFPFKLISSLWHAHRIIKTFKPHVAIGTGGFASGPLLQMAGFNNVPSIIQEQNSYPGITNKWLAKKALKICVAYTHLDRFFPKEKIVLTGNPVREDVVSISGKYEQAISFFNLDASKKTLLVLGGSLGAKRINELIETELSLFNTEQVQVIWQCGKLYYNTYKKHNSANVQVHAFLNTMDLAYAASDFIISRAGASSVSELCIVGKPVLFIPSPNVAEDHQTKNAQAIVNASAALMLKESELEMQFKSQFLELIASTAMQETLARNIKKLALKHATQDIVNEIEKLLEKKRYE